MKNIITSLIFSLLFLTSTIAQIKFEERIEFEAKDGFYGEDFFELGESGVLIRSYSEDADKGYTRWKFEKYNEDLVSVWTEYVSVPEKMYVDEDYATDDALHTLFKDKKGNYSLVTVNVADEEVTEIGGEVLKKTWISEMAILGEYAYCEAYIKKEPFLFSVNWLTGKQKLIPLSIDGIKRNKLSIESFQVLEESNEVFIYMDAIINKKQVEKYVLKLDDEGNKKSQYQLSKDIDKNLVTISARSIGGGDYIFTGTYSEKSSVNSVGLFICQAEGDNVSFIEFYNFLDLDNFLTYLPEKKQKKIEKKKDKKERKGKEFTIDYRIADHEIKKVEDGFLFLGEAYYPTYRTESYTSFVNGQSVTRYRTVFDGFQYTHAVVAKFDDEGNMEWDQTFEMHPSYKPFRVKRFISTPEDIEDGLSMVFASGSFIHTMIIDEDGKVLEDEESEKIELSREGDQIKYSTANLDYWFDDYFFAYGYQKIKNKEEAKRKDRKRKVYYMTKIRF